MSLWGNKQTAIYPPPCFFTHNSPLLPSVFREKTVKQGAAGVEPVVCCNNKRTMAHLSNPTCPLTKKPQQSCKVMWYELLNGFCHVTTWEYLVNFWIPELTLKSEASGHNAEYPVFLHNQITYYILYIYIHMSLQYLYFIQSVSCVQFMHFSFVLLNLLCFGSENNIDALAACSDIW